MKIPVKLAALVFNGILLSGCNTLYNSKAISIEIFVPAKAIFSEKIDNIAIRFNNINSDYNPKFAEYLKNNNYFTTVDRSSDISKNQPTGFLDVFVISYWNFYDLENSRLSYFYDRVDTVSWEFFQGIEEKLDRKEAIQKASEISAVQFAGFLIPHWIEVQRMVYRSGHTDMKKANTMVKEGKWLEAAEIWRKHVESPNKRIAAKSKFNMALACEILGQLDAAVDWAVQSYLVFGQKNPVHEQNSLQYINILNQRKMDIKRIEYQFNPESVPLQ